MLMIWRFKQYTVNVSVAMRMYILHAYLAWLRNVICTATTLPQYAISPYTTSFLVAQAETL